MDPLAVRESRCGGIGSFAARSVRKGELLLLEEALAVSTVGLSRENRELWIRVSELLDQQRDVYFDAKKHLSALVALRDLGPAVCSSIILDLCGGKDVLDRRRAAHDQVVLDAVVAAGILLPSARVSGEEYACLREVFRKNSFEYRHNASEGQLPDCIGDALFYRASRINHSCSPNARWELIWDELSARLNIHIFAISDIASGDEVFYSYRQMPYSDEKPRISRAQRRRWLKTHFDFDCVCSSCMAPAHASKALRIADTLY